MNFLNRLSMRLITVWPYYKMLREAPGWIRSEICGHLRSLLTTNELHFHPQIAQILSD